MNAGTLPIPLTALVRTDFIRFAIQTRVSGIKQNYLCETASAFIDILSRSVDTLQGSPPQTPFTPYSFRTNLQDPMSPFLHFLASRPLLGLLDWQPILLGLENIESAQNFTKNHANILLRLVSDCNLTREQFISFYMEQAQKSAGQPINQPIIPNLNPLPNINNNPAIYNNNPSYQPSPPINNGQILNNNTAYPNGQIINNNPTFTNGQMLSNNTAYQNPYTLPNNPQVVNNNANYQNSYNNY